VSTYLFITGNHPYISIAELFGRYPKAEFQFSADGFVIMESDAEIDQSEFDKLGGSLKCADVIYESGRDGLINAISELLTTHYRDSKLDYGLSIYGYPEKQLRPILLELKKELRKKEIKSRFINNEFRNISAAQYKSIKGKGVEVIVAKADEGFLIGETVGVQDIDFYSKRDYGKPFRDMQMGMLPPKLAQILINISGADGKIWDPFCGSGTIVMEGLLMGKEMVGTDISESRVEGAKRNIDWLKNEFNIESDAELFVHDATKPIDKKFDAIVFEGDLGIPHNKFIDPRKLEGVIDQLDDLYVRFFQNLKSMKCDKPIVCALPFFRSHETGEVDLGKTIQKIEKMGFKRTPLLPDVIQKPDMFVLKYIREDQAVGRAIYRFQNK
jgi:tRNA G10  N-methylase Trm11